MNRLLSCSLVYIGLMGLLLIPIRSAIAGHPLFTDTTGASVTLDNSQTILWNPESGDLKGGEDDDDDGNGGGCSLVSSAHAQELETKIDNAQARAMVKEAFDAWASLSNNFQVLEGNSLGVNVNANNFQNFLVGIVNLGSANQPSEVNGCNGPGACENPVVFDNNGTIIDAMFGQGASASILGIGSLFPTVNEDHPQLTINDTTARHFELLVSSACLPPAVNGCPNFSITDLKTVILHEVGHALGLGHVGLKNKSTFTDCLNQGTCFVEDFEEISIMFGVLIPGLHQNATSLLDTLTVDDINSFRTLYPDNNSTDCSISGRAFFSNGDNARCLEIVLRKTQDGLGNPVNPQIEAVTQVAGVNAPRFTQGVINASGTQGTNYENCNETDPDDCGKFLFTDLEPNAFYQLDIQTFINEGNNPVSNVDVGAVDPCIPADPLAADPPVAKDKFADVTNISCVLGSPDFANTVTAAAP